MLDPDWYFWIPLHFIGCLFNISVAVVVFSNVKSPVRSIFLSIGLLDFLANLIKRWSIGCYLIRTFEIALSVEFFSRTTSYLWLEWLLVVVRHVTIAHLFDTRGDWCRSQWIRLVMMVSCFLVMFTSRIPPILEFERRIPYIYDEVKLLLVVTLLVTFFVFDNNNNAVSRVGHL